MEEVCQEAGENGAGMHWRVCFADTRDAEVRQLRPARRNELAARRFAQDNPTGARLLAALALVSRLLPGCG